MIGENEKKPPQIEEDLTISNFTTSRSFTHHTSITKPGKERKNMNRFNITLDRPSGVYYAGEVITGSVTIDGRGEKCRSVLLTCAGKARVHWHTGSGDDRNDYDGKKYYMESKRTLYGNFYKTTVLDNAGEDAFFGGAHGEGDMVSSKLYVNMRI